MLDAEDDRAFMAFARWVAKRHSTDRGTKVGCVFVSGLGVVLAYGANTFPRGVRDLEERHQRPAKYLWTEHAERNAIYQAARSGICLRSSTAYVPWFPCFDCARALVLVGIRALVAVKPDTSDPRWGADFEAATELLSKCGVEVRFL